MNSNVAAHFQEQAAAQPDAVALVFPGSAAGSWDSWTYRELDERSDAYAAGFRADGVQRGDRTLFLVKPSLEFYALLLGLFKLGAIPTVVDPGMGLKNVLACIAHIQPVQVVAIPLVHAVALFARAPFATVRGRYVHGTKLILPGTGTAAVLEKGRAALGGGKFQVGDFGPSDEAFIVFTSGSTGTPKGVSFTHGMFAGATKLMIDELGFGPGRASLETFAPFVVFHLAAGEKVVVPDMNLSKPVTADPAKIAQAIHDHRPVCAFASPIVLRKLMDHGRAKNVRYDSLKLVLTGVAPIPGDLHTGLVPMLGEGGTIRVNYGATEALTVSYIDSAEIVGETWAKTAQGHGNCVGKPYPGMEYRVMRVTEDDVAAWSDDLSVPTETVGEVVIKGPVTSPEYKDAPAANAKSKIRDADGVIMHRSGDLGYLDAQGRLWFCGRKSHRIETSSGMVPNVPVQHVFDEHPAVFRSAVVGVGARGHEVPVACVELRPGQVWSEGLAADILARAQGTRWAGVVTRALPHPGFPMDARHNSKIRNEELKVWAEKALGGLVAQR